MTYARGRRATLVLLVGGGVAALAAAGLLARPSGATVADSTCPTDATFTNVSASTVPIGVAVVRSFTLPATNVVSAVQLSAPDGYNATQIVEQNGIYGLRVTAPRAGAFMVQATWTETYMINNPDGTTTPATCSGAGSVTLTAVRPPVPNKLPAVGIWLYDHGPKLPATGAYAIFQAYLNVSPGKYDIYGFSVVATAGTCKKDGRTETGQLIGGSVTNTRIAVKPNGSFSGTRNAVGDETGSKGTVRIKGVFNGVHVSGTATVHMHFSVYGDCRGTGKFVSRGVRIG